MQQKYPIMSIVSKNIFKMTLSKNPWFSNYTKKMKFPFIINYYIAYVCHTTLKILSSFFIFCHMCPTIPFIFHYFGYSLLKEC
jgi:hypothetical protein